MTRPNLFKYATSELSQDAFICWLIEWAQDSNAKRDSALHRTARQLLNRMFEKSGVDKPSTYDSVKIAPQYKHIDVLVIVNSEYALIIEDKTRTENHSGQLERYLTEIRERGIKDACYERKFSKDKIIAIYFKTGDQSSYEQVTKKKYTPFIRADILPILREGRDKGVANAVFIDFLENLERIEKEVESYQSIPIDKWSWPCWVGFFKVLNRRIKNSGHWEYVANPSGGFLGFHWGWHDDPICPECKVFLQLEWQKLCFKIEVENKDRQKELRGEWYELICVESNGFAKKPERFGKGKYMTVAVHNDLDYRRTLPDGTLDLDGTLKIIQEAEDLVRRTILKRKSGLA